MVKSTASMHSDCRSLLADAEAASARNDHRAGAACAREAIDCAVAAGDAETAARARAVLAGLCVVTGEFEAAGRLARLALDHAETHGPPALVAQVCNTLSLVYDRAGLAVLAVEHGMRALETARACGDRAAEALALTRLGVAVRGSEESARAIGMLEESVRIARTLPAPDAAFVPLNNLTSRWIDEADRMISLGRNPQAALRAARASADEGEAIVRVSGVPLHLALISAHIAGIHRRLGEFAAARARFIEAIDLLHAEGATAREATFRLALTTLEVEAAPSLAACAALERALDALPADVNPDLSLQSRRVLARACRALGDPDRACAHLERLLVDADTAASQRADAQWRLMQSREELTQARHDIEHARVEAEVQHVRAEADAALARELAGARDRLESEVAARTEDLRKALLDAEAASRAKGVFLALVSHELRTPLNGVLGMVEIVRRRSTDVRQVEQLDKALAAGRQLTRLVGQLLEFVAESTSARVAAADTDVRGLLGEVLLAARPDAQSKGLSLQHDVASDVPATLRLDAKRVRSVLEELLGNAVKFSREGPVRVAVHWCRDAKPAGQALEFEVVDTGPGIAPHLMQRLFNPFEMGDLSATRVHGGLGLGLALVGRRVQAMGARIEVDSVPDRGSTFRLTVPVDADPPAPQGT